MSPGSDGQRIIVIGASAGGVEAVSRIVHELPADFPASLFVSIHFPPNAVSVLPRVLGRETPLRVETATNGAAIEPARIYVAPPDRHLMIYRGIVRLSRGPTENGNRPAVDPMFRSAAVAYRRRVIGVVLTGNLDDGTAGLLAIKRRGGIAVAQDPADAMFPSMPASAAENVKLDHLAALEDIPSLLIRLVAEPLPPALEGEPMDDAERETEYSDFDLNVIETPEEHPGVPSSFSCPDCGGVLWEISDGELVRYRCRVGHGWTSDGLVAEQANTLETALWTALRALEERAALSEKLAERLARRGSAVVAERFRESARSARARAELIRRAMLEGRLVSGESEPKDREVETEVEAAQHTESEARS